MKNSLALRFLLIVAAISVLSCKSDDDGGGYTPLNIITNDDEIEVFQNDFLEFNVFQNDSNIPVSGSLTFTNPEHGVTEIITFGAGSTLLDTRLKYTPTSNYVGADTFEYTVCDSSGQSCSTGTVAINVLPISPVDVDLSQVPYPKLSDYNFFEGTLADQMPVAGVLPYLPISSLFTDYAHKKRFVWMPANTKASYQSDGTILNFPTGAVLIKTFFYENVLPNNVTKIIETRLMIHKEDGWIFADYIWNEEQNEAFLDTTGDGANVPFEWIQDGETKFVNYRIPSESQCYTCHKVSEINSPIGLKPQNLNSEYSFSDGTINQLQKWVDVGYLEDNVPTNILTVVNWEDTTQPIDLRVRSYFDINCAGCHSNTGHCDYRSLRMSFSETENPENLGICVPPDTPIPGFEDSNMITPGDPENSILFYRLSTNDEEYRMPLLGRTIRHEESLALIEEWINSLTNNCD